MNKIIETISRHKQLKEINIWMTQLGNRKAPSTAMWHSGAEKYQKQ